MKNKRVCFFAVVSFFFLVTVSARAQHVFPTPSPTPKPSPTATPVPTPPCPTVSVQGLGGRWVQDGQPLAFTLNIAGGDPKVQPTIIWSTSAGTITKGQGARRIDVDTTGAGGTPDREVKADVWVGGYAPQCVLQASSAVKIIAPATKFGEFGVVDDETLDRNLDALSTFLSQSPDNLYLIGYAGRRSERGFTADWLHRIKEALVSDGLSPRRIAVIDGGYREEPLFDFWIVPRGAQPPRPSQTLKSSDATQRKTRPAGKP
ncbi:MAG TPA: hypothetical protein VJV05_15960 [Pyrinomonadaceae bacterium]|nr:hypothetical protein [Pyrinomonadaceae bacterium]